MLIKDAQSEASRVYFGGSIGIAVSGILWLASACLATWHTPKSAILLLVIGGSAIYPVTSMALRVFGRPSSLSRSNPFRSLAIQAAFVLPLSMPLVAPVVAYRLDWSYPAMAILVGAHYLPFATLYGMRSFLALAATLLGSGMLIAVYVPGSFSLAGWVAGAVLLIFAVLVLIEWRHRAQPSTQAEAHKPRPLDLSARPQT